MSYLNLKLKDYMNRIQLNLSNIQFHSTFHLNSFFDYCHICNDIFQLHQKNCKHDSFYGTIWFETPIKIETKI
jgi:hypothetical protein